MTLLPRRPRLALCALIALAAALALAAAGTAQAAVSFGKSKLTGASVSRPTSLQFGPDGRLYVAQQNGTIKALTVERTGAGAYAATATETITLVSAMPNRDDDGALNAAVTGRLVTGLLVAGTATSPVVYVVSSDPRIGAGETKGDLNLDTNSGVLSKLTKGAGGWTKQDLVRGLPRSEENHTGNGLALDGETLYIAQGGNTNNGAPSNNFAFLPEVALSAAILRVDLTRTPYDLPTLDDPSRAGAQDAGDPFGGNDGVNQARLVPGGPVQVHAPGFRNAYDLVRTRAGRLFTIDNGGNGGWGGLPAGEGPSGMCTNAVSEPGSTNPDELFDVTAAGTYGGHPNPTRGNAGNVFAGQSPVTTSNPIECDFRVGAEAGALASFPASTNGLTEYTASNFGGELQGELLAAAYDNQILRIEPKATGPATKASLLSDAAPGGTPLDVTAQGDGDRFPGTVWYGDVFAGGVYVLEPADFGGGGTPACDPAKGDSDGDGFANADETAAGTDPCSPADTPPDLDGDRVSDRTDADDDADGRPDVADPFARDPENGLATKLPVRLGWENDDPPAGGLLGLGFTGLMTNGSADYLDQFDRSKMTAGGAAGVVTVDAVPDGDAYAGNTQQYGFQLGVDARPAGGPFTVHTRLVAPFAGTTPADFGSLGVFVGTGGQDDYVKLVAGSNGGTMVQALKETTGAPVQQARQAVTLPGPAAVDLYLQVDPQAATVQPSFTTTTGGVTSARTAVGGPLAVPASWFTGPTGLAVGILSTSAGSAPPFAATWDLLEVLPEASAPPADGAVARDAFGRTATEGWGSADTGGPWAVLGGPAADFAVGAGRATVQTPGGAVQRLVHLPGASARDVDVRATFTLPDAVPSGTTLGYLVLRRQADGGYLRVGLAASGAKLAIRSQSANGTNVAPDADTGVAFTPGAYVLRVQARGTSPSAVRAKAWRAGTAEPSGWALTASTTAVPPAAGTLGVRTIATGTAATTIGVDDLVAEVLDGTTEPPPPPPASAGLWQTLPATGLNRQEVAFTELDGKLYLAGGSTAHQVYDPVARTWSNVAPLPTKLDHIQSVAVGGKVLYIGGLAGWPNGSTGSVFVYDPRTNAFTRGADMPRPRGAGGVAVHDGRVFYAGGLAKGIAVSWFDVYDPATDTWKELPNMPTARDHFHAVVLDGRLWAIGGRNREITATTSANEAFSFASGAWATGFRPLPTPRGGFAAAAHGDEVLVIGGESTRAHAEVEAYDVTKDTWRRLAPMPTARHGIQAASCGGGIYVAAGGTTPGGGNPGQAHEVLFPSGTASACGAATPPPPPPPPPGTPVARDGFERTVADGWGAAEAGGPWSLLAGPAADAAVSGGRASLVTPAGGAQRLLHLPGATVRDADARVELTLPAPPASGGHFGYLVLRRQADGGYVRIGLASQAGKLLLRTQSATGAHLLPDVDTGLGAAGGAYLLRAQVEGTTLRARAWRAGTPEPDTWRVAATPAGMPPGAGTVGVRTANTSGTPATLQVDDLVVTPLSP